MADEPDPPRKFYQFKTRAFDAVNDVPSALPLQTPQLDPQRLSRKIDVRDLIELAGTPGPVLSAGQKASPKNEVHVVLHDNMARDKAAGLYTLAPQPKRRSRRTRDFLIVVIPLDAFFAYAAFGPYSNVSLLAYGVAGIILTTVGLGWVMFGVMDDY